MAVNPNRYDKDLMAWVDMVFKASGNLDVVMHPYMKEILEKMVRMEETVLHLDGIPDENIPYILRDEYCRRTHQMLGYSIVLNSHRYTFEVDLVQPNSNMTIVRFDVYPTHPVWGTDINFAVTQSELQQRRGRTLEENGRYQERYVGISEGRTIQGTETGRIAYGGYGTREDLPPKPDTKGPTCRRCSKTNLQEFMTSSRDQTTVCKPCFTIMQSAGVGFEKEEA